VAAESPAIAAGANTALGPAANEATTTKAAYLSVATYRSPAGATLYQPSRLLPSNDSVSSGNRRHHSKIGVSAAHFAGTTAVRWGAETALFLIEAAPKGPMC
jgi:hypothetical protein